MAILADLKDPRIQGVTVTFVEVAPDLRNAKVLVSIMGDEATQQTCLHGLQSSSGYLQQKIAKRIDTRYTPRIQFELDKGVKKSIAIAQMLGEVLPSAESGDSTGDAANPSDVGLGDAAESGAGSDPQYLDPSPDEPPLS